MVFKKATIGLAHPVPHNPDLALCDFWLFPKVKMGLKGRHFEDV